MYYHGQTSRTTSNLLVKEGRRVTRVHSEVSTMSRPHDRPVPGFTSLRQMVKQPPKSGITIVNVYNSYDKKGRGVPEPRQRPVRIRHEEEVVYKREQELGGRVCMATDQERRRALKEETVLPRWDEREKTHAGHQMLLDDYDCQRAKLEWDRFYENMERVSGERPEEMVIGPEVTSHAMGAFYGTAETQKICQSTIQQVLKCEKELQQLYFASKNVLPQTKECLEKIRWIHDCLKLFHTHFRELQAETDEKLGKRTGEHFTVKVSPPQKHELPFPRHIH